MNILDLKRSLLPLSGPQGDSGSSGGGSTNQTSSQTTTQDLPEWAKPYAQDVLSKGKAITDINQNPYQAYGGDRIAGFSNLQNQSFQGAQNMAPAAQIGQGTAAAVGAGLGGANVAGQANQYGFQNQVGGYMNPYLQMSLAPQLAEANRQYDIGATKQQSAATQAGAFGGSREAIMAAENERNRNTGLNQIVGQGYNTAFTNAQNQYNQNLQNQIAGYGLLGNAANTLGNLGQTQYQQNMGINALQNQYGGQQQAQEQKGLDTAYNDFLTQKNYPYQQLSYMSNLVRGTPMGMNTSSQVYQAPPSALGQVAGLGLGAYGLSKMAGGGLAYAGGGDVGETMNDPAAMASQVGKLSDEQLQAIIQHPTTQAEFEAAQQELAMRASERGGMAAAYNQLPQQQQQGVVQAAGGGILAFAKGGDEGELTMDPMGNVIGGDSTTGQDTTIREALGLGNRANRLALEKAEENIAKSKEPKSEAPMVGDPYNAITAMRRSDFETKVKPPAAPQVSYGGGKAGKDTGTPTTSLMDEYTKMRDMLKTESKGDMDTLNKLMEKSAGRSKEIKEQGFGKALSDFGFQMAAAAAKPGQAGNRGLAGVLRSAAEASPTIAASVAKTNELAQAADDNQQKLAIAMQQFQMAQRKGDNATALGWATQVRQLQQTDKQIALQRDHYASQAGLGAAQLAQKDRQFAETLKVHGLTAAAQTKAAEARMADVARRASSDFEKDVGGRPLYNELLKEHGGDRKKADYFYNQKKQAYLADQAYKAKDARSDMPSTGGTKSVFDYLND